MTSKPKRAPTSKFTPSPSPVFFRSSSWVLAAVPFAFLLYTVIRFGVPVPYMDQWDLVPLLQKMQTGNLTITDIWQLHNEHRLLFPQLIMLGLARLTHWNIWYELAVNVIFAVGIFLLLICQVRITAKRLGMPELHWSIPLISLIVFSISQYQNWLWGWQLQMFLSVLSVVGGIFLLANPPFTWLRFAGGAALGIVASYSFGNGGVFWLVGLFLLLVVIAPGKERKLRVALWLLVSGLTMGLYFYRYERPEAHPSLTLLFSEPIQYLSYVIKYLGNICAEDFIQDPAITGLSALIYGIGGLALMFWVVAVLRRNKLVDDKTLSPFLGLSLYSIMSALVIGIGRLGLGTDQAVTSRYCTVTSPFWAALVVMLLILQLGTKGKSITHLAFQSGTGKWAVRVVIILLGISSATGFNVAGVLSYYEDGARQLLLTLPVNPTQKIDSGLLGILHPRPQVILERFPFLKEHRLTIFRDNPSPPSAP